MMMLLVTMMMVFQSAQDRSWTAQGWPAGPRWSQYGSIMIPTCVPLSKIAYSSSRGDRDTFRAQEGLWNLESLRGPKRAPRCLTGL
eukprot:1754426-Pyramimonas_sp.AAC.2